MSIVKSLRAQVPSKDLQLEFARYSYIPQHTGTYHRKIFRISANRVSAAWLEASIKKLKPDEELALQSRMYTNGQVKFFGMIDFNVAPTDPTKFLSPVLSPHELKQLQIFSSGRSMHGYIPSV